MMPGAVRIRAARPEEARLLSAIAQEAKAHWGYPREWLELWATQLTFRAAEIARGGFRVAESGRGACGLAMVRADCRVAVLEHLWVRPRCMGRGIGRALFQDAVERAREAGCVTLRLVSDPNAAPFYRVMGCRQTGVEPSGPGLRYLPVLELALDANRSSGAAVGWQGDPGGTPA